MRKIFIFFDVDSTLVKFEGLDWLADYKKKDGEIKNLTTKSMEGDFPFRKALLKKLEILNPTQKDFEKLSRAYIKNINPEAKQTIKKLLEKNFQVFIITGSFYPAVLPLAQYLGIKPKNVFANTIFFDENEKYIGIDLQNPLSRNGGKPEVVKKILSKQNPKPYSIFVGDSVTDLETKTIVDLFVGYGGVMERKKVKNEADEFIYNLKDLFSLKPLKEKLV